MGSFKIRRLKLSQNVVEILEKKNLNSCKDVLSLTKLELQSLLGLSRSKVDSILHEISKKCISAPKTAFDIIKNQEQMSVNVFLPLSLQSLDLLLQGGLLFGSITEFTGPPGVGKTQFCFMLSILVSLPKPMGLGTQVIYIDTESAFCAERLKNMAQKRFPSALKEEKEVAQFLQRILIHKISSTTALKEVMLQLEKDVIRNKVKLIIIDSVASLMRKEFGTDGMNSLMERNKILMEQAAILKYLAQTYNLVVFLSNQVASHLVEPNSAPPDDSPDDEEVDIAGLDLDDELPPAAPVPKKTRLQGADTDRVIPALGNTWSHCVNTRLVARFVDSSVRQLTILKSPVAPNAAVHYIIDESGIVLTGDIEFVNVMSRDQQNISTKNSFLTTEVTGTGAVFTTGAVTNP
ncbi:DNA repair protein RAD51 homolog 2 [Nephila pilipes]|uniref:DNA repair protein RAD51 homolog 2 n=1 Tax=Nephila pilipes TaxID=299642 RepID=A0A8X6QZ84_NEPPI|nr:DNA repair protein RAD51 homolog 2 [Nephila pilipes]